MKFVLSEPEKVWVYNYMDFLAQDARTPRPMRRQIGRLQDKFTANSTAIDLATDERAFICAVVDNFMLQLMKESTTSPHLDTLQGLRDKLAKETTYVD